MLVRYKVRLIYIVILLLLNILFQVDRSDGPPSTDRRRAHKDTRRLTQSGVLGPHGLNY